MKLFFQFLILIATISIVACAKNTTNTSSNPLRGYENLNNDVPLDKRVADQTLPPKQDDGDPIACPKPYSLSFTTEDGKDLGRELPFVVGQKKTVLINIASKFPNLTIKSYNKPDNVSLAPVKGGYAFTFQPKSDQVNMSQRMAISVNVPQEGCLKGQGQIPEPFTVTVSSGKAQAEISNVTLDEEAVYKSTDVLSFQVDVTDPNLANNEKPKQPQFVPTTKFPTDELLPIDTRNSFSCDDGTPVNNTTSRFSCKLDLNQGKMGQSNRKDKSIATAGFSILAQSVTGEPSIAKQIILNLQFAQTAAPAAQTPESTPAPSSDNATTKPTPKPAAKPAPKTKTATARKSGART